jgi:O-antigen ligase
VPTPAPTPVPPWAQPRDATPTQWWENITSIFFGSGNSQLEGTKAFRLAWWTKIVDYTFHGPYFWMGKGFGINLATDDGFQQVGDDTLRAPHNSHLSVLARMGVPGFLLWILLQAGFALLLLRALLAYRRAHDKELAAVAAWVLVFWTAIMVNTSFDPYLEGPQGGIWFWVLFGLGLVLIRLVPRRQKE